MPDLSMLGPCRLWVFSHYSTICLVAVYLT